MKSSYFYFCNCSFKYDNDVFDTIQISFIVFIFKIVWCITNEKLFLLLINISFSDAHAKIIGGDTKYIPKNKEMPLRLSCVLIHSIEPPKYIFWYRGDRMINYDLEDGATVREGPQGSELIFPKPNEMHVGNYSCVPSNAQLDSVMVKYGSKDKLVKVIKKETNCTECLDNTSKLFCLNRF